jgi:hypothetical protein
MDYLAAVCVCGAGLMAGVLEPSVFTMHLAISYCEPSGGAECSWDCWCQDWFEQTSQESRFVMLSIALKCLLVERGLP